MPVSEVAINYSPTINVFQMVCRGRFDVFEDDADLESPGNQGNVARSSEPEQRELRKSSMERERREDHREHRRHEDRDSDARKSVSSSLVAERNRARDDDRERLVLISSPYISTHLASFTLCCSADFLLTTLSTLAPRNSK